LAEGVQTALGWAGAFGEGFAMLAAAGGPDVHPHAASKREDRERWERDVANFEADLRKVERFLLDTIDGKLKGDAVTEQAYAFFGVQGPWYTVGWKTRITIEKAFGRSSLIESMTDMRLFLRRYNDAAVKLAPEGEKPVLWDERLIRAVTGAPVYNRGDNAALDRFSRQSSSRSLHGLCLVAAFKRPDGQQAR
jgi:hypothetical protein